MPTTESLVFRFQHGERELFPAIWDAVKAQACAKALRYMDAARINGGMDQDDLRQLAAIGVWQAALSYSGGKDSRFTAWMSYHIRGHVRRALHMDRPCLDNTFTAALDGPVEGFDGEASLVDTIEDKAATSPAQAAEDKDFTEQMRRAVGRLPVNEREAVQLVYLDGHTQTDAAKILDLPRSTVCSRISSALLHLRRDRFVREMKIPHPTYHVGLKQYLNTRMSIVEDIVIRKERLKIYEAF